MEGRQPHGQSFIFLTVFRFTPWWDGRRSSEIQLVHHPLHINLLCFFSVFVVAAAARERPLKV